MDGILLFEQSLNGLQFGLMLFLLAAGLTLVFGIMDMINLAHGSLYMVGAYLIATVAAATDSFWLGLGAGVAGAALFGVLLEVSILRRLYERDHLSQVLGTFAILLMCNETVRLIWGAQPITLNPPAALSGPVELVSGFFYPAYRLFIIGVGLAVALFLYVLITRTRVGMQVRAGAANREMALAMGSNVTRLFTAVFGVGAALVGDPLGVHRLVADLAAKLVRFGVVECLEATKRTQHEEADGTGAEQDDQPALLGVGKVEPPFVGLSGGVLDRPAALGPRTEKHHRETGDQEAGCHQIGEDAEIRILVSLD